MTLDWNAFAHRAIASAALASVLPRTSGSRRVLAGPLASLASKTGTCDLVVTIDGGEDPSCLARLPKAPLVAVVVSSEAAFALVQAAREEASRAPSTRDDAFAHARSWAADVRDAPLAPPMRPARMATIAAAAIEAGFALLEPDPSSMLRVRTRKLNGSSLDRAVLATIALGATARPLLFVPASAAPRGIPKLRLERLGDARVRAHLSASLSPGPLASLGATARSIVREIAPERIAAKELLRRSRERYAAIARAQGTRFTAGSDDIREVVRAIHAAHIEGHLEIELEDTLDLLVVD